ncbi:MAG: glycerol-3-phosphate dehydrogenase [Xanthomonadales bacterium]|nr:glycerol-3-phosphate dehydrogenase [Xanthomonadales bacterium]
MPQNVDLLVVGGGINGAGIARDAAGRGYSVLLVEQDDLARHTSSASTKLIHGGLRYLEYYEFKLVRKALAERERLIGAAPHIMWPMRFVMPHDAHLRPTWMIRAGLFLYDNLAKRRRLPSSRGIDLRKHPAGAALQAGFRRGFEYSDGWVDDARLVALNAVDARERGATILTRTRCESVRREAGGWLATLSSPAGSREVRARGLVNAAGPWAADFVRERSPLRDKHKVRLVKGSHIIVPKLFDHDYAYIFQAPDRRIVFALPYEGDYTLVGTTDVEHQGAPGPVEISPAEVDYLCGMANRYFGKAIAAADVVWSYAGLRPLLEDEADDPSSVTRDYVFDLDDDAAPALSVYGGKLTTYRVLSEEAVNRIGKTLGPPRAAWTAGVPLPGGDLPDGDFARFLAEVAERWPWLPERLRHRLARAYGTRMTRILGAATSLGELGTEVLPGLYAAEIDYLVREEWVQTAKDLLWRRSKLGLHLGPEATATLAAWLASHTP